ncbi:conserved hypothetical protein [Halorhabdus utahensis DSM 12940]|uniref:Uncharacterized protein n=1 Tax=Halorhabdus utahensis (strain DSM 12940 / JCM 11049 / AX-2) TaxID=519442 RepID=C7NU88_HALUD|nr:hypothetical protein [Halorhabdus utahensis]ACV10985.1 conserved hypothetical protein [Halorhabdus utahensis DSM 12940]
MNRTLPLLAALAAVLVLVGTAAPVAAQSNATTAPNGTNATDVERIDSQTVLLDTGYNAQTGMASVTIRSETLQQITITDAGGFWQGGEIARRSVMVKPGETTTLKVPVTEVRGFVGVSIGTPNTLYGAPISGMNTNTLSFVDRLTSPEALATGAGSMALWMVIAGLYVLWIEGGEPEVA